MKDPHTGCFRLCATCVGCYILYSKSSAVAPMKTYLSRPANRRALWLRVLVVPVAEASLAGGPLALDAAPHILRPGVRTGDQAELGAPCTSLSGITKLRPQSAHTRNGRWAVS